MSAIIFFRFVSGGPIRSEDGAELFVPAFLRPSLSESYSQLHNLRVGAMEQLEPSQSLSDLTPSKCGSATLRASAVSVSGGVEQYVCSLHALKVSQLIGRDKDYSIFPIQQKKSDVPVVVIDD